MLFIFLFLNKSEVSGGTDEVIGKDVSGREPGPAGRGEPQGPGPGGAERGCLSCALRARGWGQGAGQACAQGLCSLFPRCRRGVGV